MKKNIKKFSKLISIFLVFLVIFAIPIKAFGIEFEKPTQYKYVNDYTNTIDVETRDKIIAIGKELQDKTTAEATIVIINTLDNYPIEDYANKLFREWGIGSKEKDNGLLILMAINDRKYRVEVGRGLEGAISDIYSNKVMEEVAKQRFKEGDYAGGLLDAYAVFASNIAEEYQVELTNEYTPQVHVNVKKDDDGIDIGTIIVIIALITIFGDSFFNKGRMLRGISRAFRTSNTHYYGTPTVRRKKDDDDDDFFGGFGGFGGGGSDGGGFGGFGGGSSNGGGSSGSW